jgi:hypothetical protein
MESSIIRHMARLPNMVNGKFLASPSRPTAGAISETAAFNGSIGHVESGARRVIQFQRPDSRRRR